MSSNERRAVDENPEAFGHTKSRTGDTISDLIHFGSTRKKVRDAVASDDGSIDGIDFPKKAK